jgi:hypothetical protein
MIGEVLGRLSSWLLLWSPHPEPEEIWFTTLGMVVLDELQFPSRTFADVVGGSGTYGNLALNIFMIFDIRCLL